MSILVTRPSPAGEELVSRLRTLGQVAWHFPLIEFSPGRQLPQLADQLAGAVEMLTTHQAFTRLTRHPAMLYDFNW